MRLNRRQPDLFEASPRRATDPGKNVARRCWRVRRALLTEALSREVSSLDLKRGARRAGSRADHLARGGERLRPAVDDRPGNLLIVESCSTVVRTGRAGAASWLGQRQRH